MHTVSCLPTTFAALFLALLIVNATAPKPKNDVASGEDDAGAGAGSVKNHAKVHPPQVGGANKMPTQQEIQTKINRLMAYCKSHKSNQQKTVGGKNVGGKKSGGVQQPAQHGAPPPFGDPVQHCCMALAGKNRKDILKELKQMHKPAGEASAENGHNKAGAILGGKKQKHENSRKRRTADLEPEDEEGTNDAPDTQPRPPPQHKGMVGAAANGGSKKLGGHPADPSDDVGHRKLVANPAHGAGAEHQHSEGAEGHGNNPLSACFHVECSSNKKCTAATKQQPSAQAGVPKHATGVSGHAGKVVSKLVGAANVVGKKHSPPQKQNDDE